MLFVDGWHGLFATHSPHGSVTTHSLSQHTNRYCRGVANRFKTKHLGTDYVPNS